MTVFRTSAQSTVKGHCVAPAVEVEPRMTIEELEHIEKNVDDGYRWGCDMKRLIEEVRFYLCRK